MNILVFIIYAVFVTFVSLRPMDSANLGNWDKLGHLILYFFFALIGYWAASSGRNYLYLCAVIVFYSGLMELAQSYTPGRMMSGYDLLANAAGVMVAILFTRMLFNTKVNH